LDLILGDFALFEIHLRPNFRIADKPPATPVNERLGLNASIENSAHVRVADYTDK
jgi:hypothetical protein